jgi:hypothetical protein
MHVITVTEGCDGEAGTLLLKDIGAFVHNIRLEFREAPGLKPGDQRPRRTKA